MENNENEEAAVNIAIRQRPILPLEIAKTPLTSSYNLANQTLLVDGRQFVFDSVLPPEATLSDIYTEIIHPLVCKTIKGFHCTAFAYGQTGTGKTYTMGLHNNGFHGNQCGMIARAIEDIFDQIYDSHGEMECVVAVSFIEIYNDKAFDLFDENYENPINTKGCKFTGGSKHVVEHPEEAKTLLMCANKNRHVRPTVLNKFSSRSHAIFTIHTTTTTANNKTISAFNLVDLAGSEGVRMTGHEGIARAEGVHINQGLLCVSKVLQALSSGNKVIPYRDSVLSTVLQESLTSNSYLTLLACISPLQEDLHGTLSTLRFAQNAKYLKNQPHINETIKRQQMTINNNKTLAAATPYKTTTKTPLKRAAPMNFSSNLSTIKKVPPLRSSTFCTPNKSKMPSTRVNQSCTIRRPLSMAKYSIESLNDSNSFNVSTSTEIESSHFMAMPTLHEKSPSSREMWNKLEELQSTMSVMMPMMENIRKELTSKNGPEDVTNQDVQLTRKALTSTPKKDDIPSTECDENVNAELDEEPTFKIPTARNKCVVQKTSHNQTEATTVQQETLVYESYVTDRTVLCRPEMSSYGMKRRHTIQSEQPEITIVQRRSTRIFERRELEQSMILEATKTQHGRDKTILRNITNTVKKRATKKPKKVNASVIAEYFETISETASTTVSHSKKTLLNKHKEALLKLLNTGSIKEVQVLPRIGLKTAYQIVTHRILNGPFKNFKQLSKLPVWRGNEWTRFEKANHLE